MVWYIPSARNIWFTRYGTEKVTVWMNLVVLQMWSNNTKNQNHLHINFYLKKKKS